MKESVHSSRIPGVRDPALTQIPAWHFPPIIIPRQVTTLDGQKGKSKIRKSNKIFHFPGRYFSADPFLTPFLEQAECAWARSGSWCHLGKFSGMEKALQWPPAHLQGVQKSQLHLESRWNVFSELILPGETSDLDKAEVLFAEDPPGGNCVGHGLGSLLSFLWVWAESGAPRTEQQHLCRAKNCWETCLKLCRGV